MKTKFTLGFFACLLTCLSLSSFFVKKEWTPLLDKNLSQWETYLSYRHKLGYNGKVPVDAQGKEIAPIGYNQKGQTVFTFMEEKGEPMLKVSGEVYGCVYTKQDYENYHLKLKYKWGQNKFEPRKDLLKDSGVLYHSIGKSGVDYWRAWMLSQEFQIMEGHTGDYWSIANSAIDIRAFLPEGMMNSVADAKQPFLSFGRGSGRDGLCLRSENKESKNGEWTEIELICFKGKSLHIVNGQVVMVLQNSRYVENDKTIPLTKGKIQIQSEAAEVYYKDILIKELDEMPKQYAAYF
ncbi:3-keto-disaccharide hydrolase [Rufibacter tibetensis]|uniref:3-keto-alpha-glucoside-1,2-lyase/3-keto-2-hydroxy-glucal hydratase domain-containing protein n=1 Tax=Rufibacter tibetensis TaxID=512763 RepID=A0A0P0CNB9_9BACT|nr:DUF1080 domain-containing protein [Rufibacter tibetensis]ALJ01180.1 hypothetical protein DC20_03985 [Rufibacter tibetensis]